MSDLADRAAAAVAQRKQGEAAAATGPSIQQMLTADWVVEQIQKQLGPGYDAGSYVRSVVSAIKANPDLERCDPATIFGGMFTAAQLHLEIGGAMGQSWLIPRKARNSSFGWEASFQVGYQGLLKLAYNTGLVMGVDTEIVRVGDTFKRGANSERGKFYDLDYGADHENPDAAIIGIIGMFFVRGSQRPVWRYLTLDDIERRRPDHTKLQNGSNGQYLPNTPWKTDYQAMCEKTAVIHALKFAPKSPHLALAMNVDNQALLTEPGAPDEVRVQRDGEKPEVVNLQQTGREAAAAGVDVS